MTGFPVETAARVARAICVATLTLVVGATAQAREPEPARGGRRDRSADHRSRGVTRLPAGPLAPTPGADGAGYVVESGPVDFGSLEPGVPRELPAAVRVRVFAGGEWVLRMIADSPLRLIDAAGSFELDSALSWRSASTGTFIPVGGSRPTVVARGVATGPAGQLVIVDLRMVVGDLDGLGRYGGRYRFELDSD